MIEPVILVHGGAGDIPEWRVPLKMHGVRKAVKAGYEILSNTKGCVLDAVEAAIKVMEDDEAFNAGKGSVLTIKGTIEMDAIIMEGGNLKTGAVAGLSNVAHPVTVARLVMDTTPHIFLAGPGANDFAMEKGVPFVPDDELITDFARQALEDFIHGKGEATSELGKESKHGTVGAVAIDRYGHMACATSTGGMTGKLPGRVGDTPLVGAGGYCDDASGACSATGHGESIARVCLCHHIIGLMQSGLGPKQATELALTNMHERTGGTAGAITLSNKGQVGIHFNSKRMAWAYAQNGEIHSGINPDEDEIESI